MALFGTNGVRGIANEYITPELAVNLARSLGTYMDSKGTVAIGCDTRISGQMLKFAAIAGALSTGLTVVMLELFLLLLSSTMCATMPMSG